MGGETGLGENARLGIGDFETPTAHPQNEEKERGMSKVVVKWEFDDGYAGGSRPQTTIIDGGDYEACETEEDKQKLIEESVYEDFCLRGFTIQSVEVKA